MNDLEYYEIQEKMDLLKIFILEGCIAIDRCHELIFKDIYEDKYIELALAYLNQANTFFTNAKLLSYDTGRNSGIDHFFGKFSLLNKEILDSVRTSHSYQHVDIYHDELKEAYYYLPDALRAYWNWNKSKNQ